MRSLVLVLALLIAPVAPDRSRADIPVRPMANVALCGSLKEVTTTLAYRFKELPVSFGITSRGRLLITFVSPSTGRWSIVKSWPNGYTCIIETGRSWRTPTNVKDRSP